MYKLVPFRYIFRVFTLTITVIFFAEFVYSEKITIYSDKNWQGDQVELDATKCTDIPTHLAKQVSSVKWIKTCVRLYAEENCSGRYIEMLSYAVYKNKLEKWDFDNLAASVGPCSDPCDLQVTGSVPSEDGINLTLYQGPFYRGAMATVNVKGCTLVPRKLSNVLGTMNVTSSKWGCLELYNNVDCKREGERWSGVRHDSIEIRSGNPSLDNLDPWIEHIHLVNAISHCSFKCNKNNESEAFKRIPEVPTKEIPVILYDDVNFKGNYLPIPFPGFDKCVSLDQFDEWEGEVMSIKLYTKKATCVVLYDGLNCTGSWEHNTFVSDKTLGTDKLCKTTGKTSVCPVARSLLFCNPKRNKFAIILNA